eukprot:10132633-Karenia_brevis.AAC.1
MVSEGRRAFVKKIRAWIEQEQVQRPVSVNVFRETGFMPRSPSWPFDVTSQEAESADVDFMSRAD